MPRTLLNGSEQIAGGTIPWSAMAAGAIVPIASIVNGGQIILSTGAVAMGASLQMGGNSITGLGAPVNSTDAATKIYIDDKVGGVGGIFFVQTIAIANVTTLSGLPTIDSFTMTAGQIVLLAGQTTGSQNGPWTVSSGAWTRPIWWATGTISSPGSFFYVENYGTLFHDTKWWMTTVGTITVDTTAIAFAQDSSGTTYSAGAGGGLTLTGGAFSVNTGNGITLTSGNVTAVGTGIIGVGASGIGITNASAAGQVILGNASDVATWTALSGDASLNGTGVVTLSSVNANVGAFGAGGSIPVVTVNAKGLITAVTTATVTAAAGSLTGTALAANVVSSSLTSVGTLTTGTWAASPIGIAFGGTGATSAVAGFDALAPMTTAGDLMVGGTAGTGLRLAVGSASQVLVGGTTPTWGSVNLSTMASGTLQAAQFPALTGAVTTTAGSLVTTLAAGSIALTSLAAIAANTVVGNATGGSAVPTALTVSQSRVLLGIDERTAVSDAAYTVTANDYLISYTTITAARIVSLPAASSFAAGRELGIQDESGAVSASLTISAAPSGTDTINGLNTTQILLNSSRGRVRLISNGSNGWTVANAVLTGDVTSAGIASATGTTITAIGGKSISLGGALTLSGAFGTTLTVTGSTALTLPTSGTVTALGNTVTGSGSIVLATSPTLVTPALGTPASGVLTNATGLPISTGVAGLATGIAATLATAANAAGGMILFSGSLGTPVQGVLTNLTGLPISTGVSGLGTGVATGLANAATGSGSPVLGTAPTVSGATLSGTTTISNAPILSALSGFVFANAGAAATAVSTLPSTALNMSVNETPTGALNGTNTIFTLAHSPANSSLEFHMNGVLLRPGATNDYTVSTTTVTMNFAPAAIDYVAASYFF